MNIRNIILNLKSKILNLKSKMLNLIHKIKKIVIIIFNFIKENFQFEKTLKLIGYKPLKQLLTSWFVSAIGIILNFFSENKLPNFFIMWLLLYVILFITCSTTARINAMKHHLNEEMSGDAELVSMKTEYIQVSHNNKNYIFPFVGAILITSLAFLLLHINITFMLKVYCFSSLFAIVWLCIVGAIQYYYLLFFLIQISKHTDNITNYNNELPYRTKWLNYITKEIHFSNSMYFLVGMIVIILLYQYMFTSFYGVCLTAFKDQILCLIFWGIIFIFIILGFPTVTILGYIYISKTISGFKDKEERFLKAAQQNADKNLSINIGCYIIELNNTPNYPVKHPLSYIFSFIVGTINLLASLEAVGSLIGIVSQSM